MTLFSPPSWNHDQYSQKKLLSVYPYETMISIMVWLVKEILHLYINWWDGMGLTYHRGAEWIFIRGGVSHVLQTHLKDKISVTQKSSKNKQFQIEQAKSTFNVLKHKGFTCLFAIYKSSSHIHILMLTIRATHHGQTIPPGVHLCLSLRYLPLNISTHPVPH